MTLFITITTPVMHGARHAARTAVGVSISLQAGFEFRTVLLQDCFVMYGAYGYHM